MVLGGDIVGQVQSYLLVGASQWEQIGQYVGATCPEVVRGRGLQAMGFRSGCTGMFGWWPRKVVLAGYTGELWLETAVAAPMLWQHRGCSPCVVGIMRLSLMVVVGLSYIAFGATSPSRRHAQCSA